jgi:hypothetical protein
VVVTPSGSPPDTVTQIVTRLWPEGQPSTS